MRISPSSRPTGVLSGRVPLPRDPLVSTAVQQITGGLVILLVSVATGELAELRPEQVTVTVLLGAAVIVSSVAVTVRRERAPAPEGPESSDARRSPIGEEAA